LSILLGDAINWGGGMGCEVFVVVENHLLVVVEANYCGNATRDELNA